MLISRCSGGAHVNMVSHRFTHLIHKWSETYLPLLPSSRASPHFGRYSFNILLRVGGWVGPGSGGRFIQRRESVHRDKTDLGTDKFAGGEDGHNERLVSVDSLQQVALHTVVDVQQVMSVGPSVVQELIRQWSAKYQNSPTLMWWQLTTILWPIYTSSSLPVHIPSSALTLLVGQEERHPACKKIEWWGAGMVVCLGRGADLHMAQLMPLPPTVLLQ